MHTETRGRARWITLDRPKANVFDVAMLEALASELTAPLPRDASIVVITHAGRFFSAGVEVADHIGLDNARGMLGVFRRVFEALVACPLPTVALCRGPAFGGGAELALACDMVLAAEGVEFSLPEIKLGVFPPQAAAALPRLAGKRALEMLLTGDPIRAEDALPLGLVNRVLAPEQFEAEAEAFVQRFEALSSAALRALVRVLRRADAAVLRDMEEAERVYLDELMASADAGEGLQAFVDRREPVWRHE